MHAIAVTSDLRSLVPTTIALGVLALVAIGLAIARGDLTADTTRRRPLV